jgi:hypothetical protein
MLVLGKNLFTQHLGVIKMKVLAIGSDPEFFIQDRDGKVVPSRGIIPGTKEKLRRLSFQIGRMLFIRR